MAGRGANFAYTSPRKNTDEAAPHPLGQVNEQLVDHLLRYWDGPLCSGPLPPMPRVKKSHWWAFWR